MLCFRLQHICKVISGSVTIMSIKINWGVHSTDHKYVLTPPAWGTNWTHGLCPRPLRIKLTSSLYICDKINPARAPALWRFYKLICLVILNGGNLVDTRPPNTSSERGQEKGLYWLTDLQFWYLHNFKLIFFSCPEQLYTWPCWSIPRFVEIVT